MAALVRTALRSAVGCALRPLLGLNRGPLSALLAGPPGGAAPGGAGPGPQPALGFKTKGVIKRRCKDCYLVKRRGRWFIYCKSNPRHKQRQM